MSLFSRITNSFNWGNGNEKKPFSPQILAMFSSPQDLQSISQISVNFKITKQNQYSGSIEVQSSNPKHPCHKLLSSQDIQGFQTLARDINALAGDGNFDFPKNRNIQNLGNGVSSQQFTIYRAAKPTKKQTTGKPTHRQQKNLNQPTRQRPTSTKQNPNSPSSKSSSRVQQPKLSRPSTRITNSELLHRWNSTDTNIKKKLKRSDNFEEGLSINVSIDKGSAIELPIHPQMFWRIDIDRTKGEDKAEFPIKLHLWSDKVSASNLEDGKTVLKIDRTDEHSVTAILQFIRILTDKHYWRTTDALGVLNGNYFTNKRPRHLSESSFDERSQSMQQILLHPLASTHRSTKEIIVNAKGDPNGRKVASSNRQGQPITKFLNFYGDIVIRKMVKNRHAQKSAIRRIGRKRNDPHVIKPQGYVIKDIRINKVPRSSRIRAADDGWFENLLEEIKRMAAINEFWQKKSIENSNSFKLVNISRANKNQRRR